MPKFKVKVDHIMTYDVTLEAADEDEAENNAIEMVQSHIAEEAYSGEASGDHIVTYEEEQFDIENTELVPEPKPTT